MAPFVGALSPRVAADAGAARTATWRTAQGFPGTGSGLAGISPAANGTDHRAIPPCRCSLLVTATSGHRRGAPDRQTEHRCWRQLCRETRAAPPGHHWRVRSARPSGPWESARSTRRKGGNNSPQPAPRGTPIRSAGLQRRRDSSPCGRLVIRLVPLLHGISELPLRQLGIQPPGEADQLGRAVLW